MSDQQTPENQPSAAAEPNPTTDATPEPSFGPGSDHFRGLAEVEKQKVICSSEDIYEKIVIVIEGVDRFIDPETGKEANIAFWLP